MFLSISITDDTYENKWLTTLTPIEVTSIWFNQIKEKSKNFSLSEENKGEGI